MTEQNVENTLNTSEAAESRGDKNSPEARQSALESANKALARANVESARLVIQLQEKVELLKNELLRYHTAIAKIDPEIRRASQALCGMRDTYCNQIASECEKYRQVLCSLEQPLILSTGILTHICNPSAPTYDQATTCNLRQLLSELLDEYASLAATKQIEMELSFAPELPETTFLPVQNILQITRELINNAIKHSRASVIAVSIGIEETAPQESIVQLRVTDDGIGISAETLSKINEAIQGHSKYAMEDRAIGLGYTLLPRLAELCEGSLMLESIQGSGTSVLLELPLSHHHTTATAAKRHFESLSQTLKEASAPLQVAVVAEGMEQLANDCQAIAELATKGEASILTNWSQVRAFLLNPRNVQACLLLHGDCGIECMRRLKEVFAERQKRQCVLYLSTASNPVTTSELRDLGVDGMLRIPITATRLRDVLRGVKGRVAS